MRFGAFAFHADRRQLTNDGADVHLTPKAFDLLALLLGRTPGVVSKAEIHARLWPDTFVSDATLVGVVKELRRALGDEHQDRIIRTAHRVGYAFAMPVEPGSAPPSRRVPECWLAPATGERLPLGDGDNVLGRAPDATIWLQVAGISRHHARIVVQDGAASIDDLGSKNGTFVGDRAVRGTMPLKDGDRIRLATEVLTFRASVAGVSTVTTPVGVARTTSGDEGSED